MAGSIAQKVFEKEFRICGLSKREKLRIKSAMQEVERLVRSEFKEQVTEVPKNQIGLFS